MAVDNNDNKHWHLRSEQKVYDGSPWVSLYRQHVTLPDGKEVDDYHRLALPDFSVIYALTGDQDVLTLKLYKHGLGKVTHALPGGIVEYGEDPLETAKRELLEETGYKAPDWQALGCYTVNGNLGAGCGHFYKATGARKVQESDDGDLEDMLLLKIPEKELITMVKAQEFQLLNHASCIALAQLL